MSVSKCVSASGYGISCQAGNLEAEIARLTRELDEAREGQARLLLAKMGNEEEIGRLRSVMLHESKSHKEKLAECQAWNREIRQKLAELEARLAWRKVSEKPPQGTDDVLCVYDDGEYYVLAYDGKDWFRRMDDEPWVAPTHWMPLPAAPNKAEPT